MSNDIAKKDQIDILFKLYQEHTTHGRHHETQRSTTSTIMVAIAAGVAGLIKNNDQSNSMAFWLALFLVIIGCFGALFVYKQYERYRLHTDRAKRYRDALDELMPNRTDILPETCFDLSEGAKKFLKGQLAPKPIKALKRVADADHESKHAFMYKYSLHLGWVLVQLCIAALGVILAVITFPGWNELLDRRQPSVRVESRQGEEAPNPGLSTGQ